MSIKTYFKKVAVVAAMALTLGGFTAISAQAATVITASSYAVNAPSGAGTVSIDVTGSNGESDTFTVTGSTPWSVTTTSNPGLTVIPSSGTGGTFTVTKNNASTETFDLSVTVSGANGSTREVSAPTMAGGPIVFTKTAPAVNGTLAASAFTGVTASATTGTLQAGNAITVPGITYGVTLDSTAATGGGTPQAITHVLNASVSGPGSVASAGFTSNAVAIDAAGAGDDNVIASGAGAVGNTNTNTFTSSTTGSDVIVMTTSYSFTPSVAGTYTVTFSGAGVATLVRTVVVGVDLTQAIWRYNTSTVGGTVVATGPTATSGDVAITGGKVTGAGQVIKIKAVAGSTPILGGTGNYNYAEVTGSTFAAQIGADFVLGTLNSGTTLGTSTQVVWNTAAAANDELWINAAAAGDITVKWYAKRTDSISLLSNTTLLQTVTISLTAPGALSPAVSTSVINGTNASGVVSTPTSGAGFAKDQVVLAPATLASAGGLTSAAGTAKAVIKVTLTDSEGAELLGTLPAVGASIAGPGTLSLSLNAGAANADGSTGRLLTAAAGVAGVTGSPFAAGRSVFYINVFSDGTSGASTVSIWVGGSVWKTETLSFYGAVTKLTATQNHKVLKSPSTTGCVGVVACDGSSVALSPAVVVVATDANGIAVPGVTVTGVSSDKTIITGSSSSVGTDAADILLANSIGNTWFSVSTAAGLDSGKSASLTYKTTVAGVDIVSNAVSFAIGGAAVSYKASVDAKATNIGALNALTITGLDAAGNAPYDMDVTSVLKSDMAVTTAIGSRSNVGTGEVPMIGGTSGAISFYNPIIPATLTFSGTVEDLPVSVTFSVVNPDTTAADNAQAATDAAAEATDAANAATDAANAAAEAADAATAAAQDAADAVAALSAQVTAMISALKKQLIALTNLVIKIQKKVRA